MLRRLLHIVQHEEVRATRRETVHECLVPGCALTGRNQIGLRVRIAHSGRSPFLNKKRTDALVSLESVGFLCDVHALAGGHFEVSFVPNRTMDASIRATCGENSTEVRSKPIPQPLSEAA